jgi:hypothetical protein
MRAAFDWTLVCRSDKTGRFSERVRRVSRLSYRNVVTWLLLAAFWLQAATMPGQFGWTMGLDGSAGEPICASGTPQDKRDPAAPAGKQQQHDCCLCGACATAHAVIGPIPVRAPRRAVAIEIAFSRSDQAGPRAPPGLLRPYTTGPPTAA